MEFLALGALMVVIVRYAQKRSKLVSYSCSVLFALIFTLSLFTTQIPFVQELMQWIYGDFYYQFREALITPCIWIYSASAALALIEIIIAAIFAIVAANKAVKILCRIVNDFYRSVNTKEIWEQVPAKNTYSHRKLFLKCCRLRN